MRLRLAFKLNGQEADLARYIADASGVDADKIAKLAMQRYMREVISRAEDIQSKIKAGELTLPNEGDDNGLQSSNPDPVHAAGTVQVTPDSVPGETPGQ